MRKCILGDHRTGGWGRQCANQGTWPQSSSLTITHYLTGRWVCFLWLRLIIHTVIPCEYMAEGLWRGDYAHILRWRGYPGLSRWLQCHHKGPYEGRRRQGRGIQRGRCEDRIRGQGDAMAGFENGGRGPQPRNAGSLWLETAKKRGSPLEHSWQHFYFSCIRPWSDFWPPKLWNNKSVLFWSHWVCGKVWQQQQETSAIIRALIKGIDQRRVWAFTHHGIEANHSSMLAAQVKEIHLSS